MSKDATRFPEDIANILKAAGWFPGRCVEGMVDKWKAALDHPGGLKMFSAAREVLLEFGGLRVDQQGPGVTCAREPFVIDPMTAVLEDDYFSDWGKTIGVSLYPLGEAASANYYLAIDECGRVFLSEAELIFLGESFDDALVNLIRGIIGKRVTGVASGQLVLVDN